MTLPASDCASRSFDGQRCEKTKKNKRKQYLPLVCSVYNQVSPLSRSIKCTEPLLRCYLSCQERDGQRYSASKKVWKKNKRTYPVSSDETTRAPRRMCFSYVKSLACITEGERLARTRLVHKNDWRIYINIRVHIMQTISYFSFEATARALLATRQTVSRNRVPQCLIYLTSRTVCSVYSLAYLSSKNKNNNTIKRDTQTPTIGVSDDYA